ncbi:MAG TPA: antitoxin Xre-like helix-turn-helix domain-containing protein [Kiloniellales bacterium]|nr:antitoxin Xre-like helix-turn-helix domain-containing protein [Kiloniellales bacterium]
MARRELAERSATHRGPDAPDLGDAATRRRLSEPGLGAFRKVAEALRLTIEEQCTLLGAIPRRTFHRWIAGGAGELARDQLERISLTLGIFKALQILFPVAERRDAWLRAANGDQPFGGQAPLAYLLEGSQQHLWEARRYLDAWRGGWP